MSRQNKPGTVMLVRSGGPRSSVVAVVGRRAASRAGKRSTARSALQQAARKAHPLADGASGLVGRQDTLAGGGNGLGSRDQLRGILQGIKEGHKCG